MKIKKKLKRKTVSDLKGDAWKLFSEYIRRKYADWKGDVRCVTCGVVKQWNRGMQAGHFLPGRRNAILFDERNVHPQCEGCNRWKQGEQLKYYRFMVKTYGEEVVEELEDLNKTTIQFTTNQLEFFIVSLKVKLKNLS